MKNKKQSPLLMGILNCTPDSFFDGGRYFNSEKAIAHGLEMITDGADIIDIGGESTRPGAMEVSAEEEIRRIVPVIKALQKATISIDSCKPCVVEAALNAGASFINDVTGFTHPDMRKLAAEAKVPICVMHMQGAPRSMQKNPHYPKGVITEICSWFERQIEYLLREGVAEDKIYLDPGIGFGKTVQHNLDILSHLSLFQKLDHPLLIGLSRKSFISKILNKPSTELLSTSLALNTMCILEGVAVIRVHDVKAHREMLSVVTQIG